ncbi:MAG TPA: hypothetical protein VLE73_06335 [Candidatus Saccharimonadales bacterium]|nr:hypothetical protein [Candidatus Saccharimonadales bacterium]
MRTARLIQTTALSLVAAITITTAAPVIVIAAQNNGPTTDNSTNVSTGEVNQALTYTPGVLAASDQSQTTGDSSSAIVATTADATIKVPKDANDGITMAVTNGPSVGIQLPNASKAGDAKQVAQGVVAYAGTNGSANAVQTVEAGGVRMLTVIDNRNAATTYDYKISLPDGGRIELGSSGNAVILDEMGALIASISAPWATDAKGGHVRTWFTTDGTTLTQHISHRTRGTVYPVTADPYFDWKWYGVNIYIEQYNVNRIVAMLSTGAGALGIGAVITGGGGAPAAALGAAVLSLGGGAIGWCSYKGRGMWIHVRPGVTWCNNG